MVLADTSTVEIEVVRGPGLLVADNSAGIEVGEGEVVTMHQSGEFALVYDLAGFMCPECRALRHHKGRR